MRKLYRIRYLFHRWKCWPPKFRETVIKMKFQRWLCANPNWKLYESFRWLITSCFASLCAKFIHVRMRSGTLELAYTIERSSYQINISATFFDSLFQLYYFTLSIRLSKIWRFSTSLFCLLNTTGCAYLKKLLCLIL